MKTVINSLTFDGTENDPVKLATQVALLAFMAGRAQSQIEISKEAQRRDRTCAEARAHDR